jgi:hypothetical protein
LNLLSVGIGEKKMTNADNIVLTESRFTLWLESADRNLKDQILGCGMTLAEAAKCIREFEGGDIHLINRNYRTFRSFELERCDIKTGTRIVIGATVPKTKNFEEDRRRALEMIDVQTIHRDYQFWEGNVSRDADYIERVAQIKKKRAAAEIDREIVTKVVDRLLAMDYHIYFELHVNDPKDFEAQVESLVMQGYKAEGREEDKFFEAERHSLSALSAPLRIALSTWDGRFSGHQYRVDCYPLTIDCRLAHGWMRAAFLNLLFEKEASVLFARNDRENYFIELAFGETGGDVVWDYSEELSALVDPIVSAHRPTSRAEA